MFESATAKLTLIYMGILTLISIFFSYNWYSIAVAELDRGLERQRVSLTTRPRLNNDQDLVDEVLQEAQIRYEEAKDVILGRVLISNVIIISAGTFGSFLLARRTLDPIEKSHAEQLRFTADASHELRTPLAAMQTEIEVALRDPKLSKKEAVELLHSNTEELTKLSSLSEALLTLARQDESVAIDMRRVSLNAMITKAIDRVEKQAKLRDITIIHDVIDEKVIADFDSIVDLLVILLDNAIKYSPEKSSILVETDNEIKNFVQIHVRDSGIGITKADQEHVFERFFRADNSRNQQHSKGHGLGLSIAKNISEIHDARISVKSGGEGTGSDFFFRLKRA